VYIKTRSGVGYTPQTVVLLTLIPRLSTAGRLAIVWPCLTAPVSYQPVIPLQT